MDGESDGPGESGIDGEDELKSDITAIRAGSVVRMSAVRAPCRDGDWTRFAPFLKDRNAGLARDPDGSRRGLVGVGAALLGQEIEEQTSELRFQKRIHMVGVLDHFDVQVGDVSVEVVNALLEGVIRADKGQRGNVV